ncbi:MAG: hypothetical protein F6K48_35040 [Okeania sp. SIO3H1]|nr:hypothetical protein [Okeania sp. SIO3H1]
MESLFVGVGDRRQPTPNPSGGGEDRRQEKWLGSEEVGVKIFSQFFCHNHPKILTF